MSQNRQLPVANGPTDTWPEVVATSREALTPEVVDRIEQARLSDEPDSYLIAILHQVQSHFGYLGPKQLDAVAQLMQVPAAKVSGVASFYHFFRLQPTGRYKINVCLGTACYVKGAEAVAQKLQEELGITYGETTKDGMFTLEPSRCLGTCGLAPVLMIGDEVHSKVTADRVPVILQKYLDRARAEDAARGISKRPSASPRSVPSPPSARPSQR
jgi:NADH-quinone oxidoreductase E subunit